MELKLPIVATKKEFLGEIKEPITSVRNKKLQRKIDKLFKKTGAVDPTLQKKITKHFDLYSCKRTSKETLPTSKRGIRHGEGTSFKHSTLQCSGGKVDIDEFTRNGNKMVGLVHDNKEVEFLKK